MNDAVFEGCFVGVKPAKSRGVYTFHIEVDEQMADECLRRIGGLPRASESRRVAVALLESESGNAPETALRPASTNGDADNATASKREDADT